ncbi:MAG TPA: hypothetical protein VNJ08_00905 [Bacteriovoracaceae bacterium]|nr:hypothetical protein [Bacteriovoracaceae bacterium]
MDIEACYQKVLLEISKEHRALIRFSRDEMDYLLQGLPKNIGNHTELEKILCLIDHSAIPHLPFEDALIQCLNADLPSHLIVFTLDCSRKHIIQARGQRGQRLSYEFLEALKKKLHSRAPEVVEWTLRTIEECGSQGVYFLREFDKIKPPPWKWFSVHQRAVREIIAMLERRWGQFEKS